MNIQRPVYSTAATPLQERDGLSARVDRVAFAPASMLRRPALSFHVHGDGVQRVRGRGDDQGPQVGHQGHRLRALPRHGGGRTGGTISRGSNRANVFRFESYHVVASDSMAEGALLACDDAGQRVLVRLAPFVMRVPV